MQLERDKCGVSLDAPGKYANNNYVNGINGRGRKTNWRKRHSNYRHPTGYGANMEWCPRDQRQIEDMEQQIEENNYVRSKDSESAS